MRKRTLFFWIVLPAAFVILLTGALVVAAIWFFPSAGDGSSGGSGGAGWSLFSFKSKAKEVRIHTVERGSVVAIVSAPGIVTPARETAISSRLAGRVLEILVDEGYAVEEGQVLARLETKEIEIALERAQSDLDVAEARLDQTKASWEQAGISARRSLADLERKEALHGQGAFSDSEIDRARNQADADQLLETVAKKNLREAEEAARSARLALEKVERDLDETDIRSPLGGTVTARNVNVGERVILGIAGDPSAALFVVSDLSEILVYADVDESDVSRLKPDQPVAITVEALKDVEFTGRTIDIAPRARRIGEISTFRTRVLVQGDTSALRPGMSAQVEIEVQRVDEALIVPIEAVVERDEEREEGEEEERRPSRMGKEKKEWVEVVFRVEEEKAGEVEVKTGISDNTNIEIVKGLEDGDRIVAGPYRILDELKDGDLVVEKKKEKKREEEGEAVEEEGDAGSGESEEATAPPNEDDR